MIIEGFKYTRYEGYPRQWEVAGNFDEAKKDDYVHFGGLNLLVGKNAVGKSRTLTMLKELGELLSEDSTVKDLVYHTQKFDFIFNDNSDTYRYYLNFKEYEIISEIIELNGQVILNREEGFFVTLNEKHNLPSNLSVHQPAVCMKRGVSDYFFKPLVLWGYSVINFLFSDHVSKDTYCEDLDLNENLEYGIEDLGRLIPMFHRGKTRYKNRFVKEVLNAMNLLGYNLTNLDVKKTQKGHCLIVEEAGKYTVSQQEMSHGMFRVLSLYALIIYARLSKYSVCILIDDIGEGLDHERSKTFIDTILKYTYNTEVQYFISTNDRYVMNYVRLKYWTIIDRDRKDDGKSIFYNIENSEGHFDDFKYTGLNNFDFFTTEFYKKGFAADEESTDEDEEFNADNE